MRAKRKRKTSKNEVKFLHVKKKLLSKTQNLFKNRLSDIRSLLLTDYYHTIKKGQKIHPEKAEKPTKKKLKNPILKFVIIFKFYLKIAELIKVPSNTPEKKTLSADPLSKKAQWNTLKIKA